VRWPTKRYGPGAPISPPMIIVLPEMLEDAWARALPGREAAAQNEVLRLVRSLSLTLPESRRSSWAGLTSTMCLIATRWGKRCRTAVIMSVHGTELPCRRRRPMSEVGDRTDSTPRCRRGRVWTQSGPARSSAIPLRLAGVSTLQQLDRIQIRHRLRQNTFFILEWD
jgi:hypothetical protein